MLALKDVKTNFHIACNKKKINPLKNYFQSIFTFLSQPDIFVDQLIVFCPCVYDPEKPIIHDPWFSTWRNFNFVSTSWRWSRPKKKKPKIITNSINFLGSSKRLIWLEPWLFENQNSTSLLKNHALHPTSPYLSRPIFWSTTKLSLRRWSRPRKKTEQTLSHITLIFQYSQNFTPHSKPDYPKKQKSISLSKNHALWATGRSLRQPIFWSSLVNFFITINESVKKHP